MMPVTQFSNAAIIADLKPAEAVAPFFTILVQVGSFGEDFSGWPMQLIRVVTGHSETAAHRIKSSFLRLSQAGVECGVCDYSLARLWSCATTASAAFYPIRACCRVKGFVFFSSPQGRPRLGH